MSFRKIKADKIRKVRGARTLQEIADASGGQFTKGVLWQWENSRNRKPSDDNIPILLMALGCSYEDISEPVEVAYAA